VSRPFSRSTLLIGLALRRRRRVTLSPDEQTIAASLAGRPFVHGAGTEPEAGRIPQT
jgi:hypothetical protein